MNSALRLHSVQGDHHIAKFLFGWATRIATITVRQLYEMILHLQRLVAGTNSALGGWNHRYEP